MAAQSNEDPGYTHGDGFARVGRGDHVVQPGECMASIADMHGFFWETLWNHPGNAELKQARGDPNILMPGDKVTIPPLSSKSETRPTEARHQFRRKGVPEKLRMQFIDADGAARADLAYQIDMGGVQSEGVTDADGYVELWIMPQVTRASLRFIDDAGRTIEAHDLQVGELPPLDSGEGIAARLCNLGFGAPGQPLDFALAAFQSAQGLDVSGTFDDATRDKLKELAGS